MLFATILSLTLSSRVGQAPLTVRVTLHVSEAVRDDSQICFEVGGDGGSASCWPPQDKRTWERLVRLPEGTFTFQGQIRYKDQEGKSHVEITTSQTVLVIEGNPQEDR